MPIRLQSFDNGYRMQLTAMDVHQLIKDPSSVPLTTLAEKVASAFASNRFNSSEAAIASDIFRLLLRDTEKSVRQKLAENLYESSNVPHDIIFDLACDEPDISQRVLQYSPVLSDEDLIKITRSTKEILKLCAIARRENLSDMVSGCLIDTKREAVLRNLLENQGAYISEENLVKAWDMVSGNNSLLEVLVNRGNLPLTIAEKILSVASEDLKERVVRKYRLNSSLIKNATADAREWALLGIMPVKNISHPDDDSHIDSLVLQLGMTGKMTHSLVLRALCMGFLNMFEAGLAYLANVPRANARILLMGGHKGFTAIYDAAEMPESFADAAEKILILAQRITSHGYEKPEDFRRKLIEAIYVSGYHNSVDGMNYLLSIINGKISSNYPSESVH